MVIETNLALTHQGPTVIERNLAWSHNYPTKSHIIPRHQAKGGSKGPQKSVANHVTAHKSF